MYVYVCMYIYIIKYIYIYICIYIYNSAVHRGLHCQLSTFRSHNKLIN